MVTLRGQRGLVRCGRDLIEGGIHGLRGGLTKIATSGRGGEEGRGFYRSSRRRGYRWRRHLWLGPPSKICAAATRRPKTHQLVLLLNILQRHLPHPLDQLPLIINPRQLPSHLLQLHPPQTQHTLHSPSQLLIPLTPQSAQQTRSEEMPLRRRPTVLRGKVRDWRGSRRARPIRRGRRGRSGGECITIRSCTTALWSFGGPGFVTHDHAEPNLGVLVFRRAELFGFRLGFPTFSGTGTISTWMCDHGREHGDACGAGSGFGAGAPSVVYH